MVRVVSARTCVRVDSSIRNRARQNEIRANSINSLARQLFIFYKKRVSDTCINTFLVGETKKKFYSLVRFFFFFKHFGRLMNLWREARETLCPEM